MARTANRPLPAGRLAPIEVAAFGFVCGSVGLSLSARSQSDDGPLGVCYARAVRACLHAAQAALGLEHGSRRHSGSTPAGARVDRRGMPLGLGGLFAICDFVPVAVPAFPRHRLALSPRLRGRRPANAPRHAAAKGAHGAFGLRLRGRFDSDQRRCRARWRWRAGRIAWPRCSWAWVTSRRRSASL